MKRSINRVVEEIRRSKTVNSRKSDFLLKIHSDDEDFPKFHLNIAINCSSSSSLVNTKRKFKSCFCFVDFPP